MARKMQESFFSSEKPELLETLAGSIGNASEQQSSIDKRNTKTDKLPII